ncbi:MAG: hypothetical protein COB66_08100 [Coxiella sp. (in: Bacteria)]|nr:MAG: hypothetical protein COB66_08100 [Coxiella sp. (in: g-proteobacteria)]
MKTNNPTYGHRRIAMQINNAFGLNKDLENKLESFRFYYNEERSHHGIDGLSPLQKSGGQSSSVILLENYRWKKHCRSLFKLPMAA